MLNSLNTSSRKNCFFFKNQFLLQSHHIQNLSLVKVQPDSEEKSPSRFWWARTERFGSFLRSLCKVQIAQIFMSVVPSDVNVTSEFSGRWVIMEARRRTFSPVLSFLLGFVCSFLHACVCFRPGVLHTQNKQNLLFSIVPFIVPFSQLRSSVLKRKEGHCQRRSHHFVFCVAHFSYYNSAESGREKWVLLVSVCMFILSNIFMNHWTNFITGT